MQDSNSDRDAEPAAQWPEKSELPEVATLPDPHPSTFDRETLLQQCQFQALKRGGPGGQHRNKVSSAVRLVHSSTGVSSEANERRDQSQNLSVAVQRLRLRLAILYRTTPEAGSDYMMDLRRRWTNTNLKISDTNADHAAVLALLLDDLHRAGGQPSLVASLWQTSTSAVVRFVASVPSALILLNQWREHHGRRPLKAH